MQIFLLASQGSGGSGEAIGTIVPRLTGSFTTASEASKYLYCDGSTFSASQYPKLYNILGTNQLPDLRGRFLEGNDIGNQIIEAGLPNITGNVGIAWATINKSVTYGSFYAYAEEHNGSGGGGVSGGYYNNIDFNASRSSAIYGKSNTVQPPAVTVRYYIRAK